MAVSQTWPAPGNQGTKQPGGRGRKLGAAGNSTWDMGSNGGGRHSYKRETEGQRAGEGKAVPWQHYKRASGTLLGPWLSTAAVEGDDARLPDSNGCGLRKEGAPSPPPPTLLPAPTGEAGAARDGNVAFAACAVEVTASQATSAPAAAAEEGATLSPAPLPCLPSDAGTPDSLLSCAGPELWPIASLPAVDIEPEPAPGLLSLLDDVAATPCDGGLGP